MAWFNIKKIENDHLDQRPQNLKGQFSFEHVTVAGIDFNHLLFITLELNFRSCIPFNELYLGRK